MKLWGGRFRKPTAPELERLGSSIDFDRRLAREEIEANRAYARQLKLVGVLTDDELPRILDGLDRVEETLAGEPLLEDEDIHTAVERLLGDTVGEVAGKLATGRSRNDLAATEFRLYLSRAIAQLASELSRLQTVLLARAREATDAILPGYTHLRRGQPVVFAQYLLAYFWSIQRDRERFIAARARCLESPLGAGALAGNPFGVDRAALAKELGFHSVLPNSIDAISARDYALEFLSASAILATHLSRMAEDLILWSSPEFGFVKLDESYATGSSLMPQKQNPDGLELIRGKSGRLVGNLVSLLTTVKGLATGYQRDLQEDKEPVFDSLDTLANTLPVMRGTVETLALDREGMRRALSLDLLATDLADYLVHKGLAFRSAHKVAGQVLARASELSLAPDRLPLPELEKLSELFEEDVASVWDFDQAIARKTSEGGVAPEAIRVQLERAAASIEE